MGRGLILASAGLVVGAAATFAAFQHGFVRLHPDPAGSPIIENVPIMTPEAAATHRDSHYASIRTITDVLALPGDFAQTEALYALAGRADSAGVQDLIFQANGITDPSDRKAALEILFSRLTELDVRSALALSRTSDFRAERQIEAGIWHGWAKLDLDAALAGAAALDTLADRNLAAQALFAAYDYRGNETTDYIEEILGIGPDSTTRTTHLFRAGDRDPAEAIGMINEMILSEQFEAASYLGHRLGRLDGAHAAGHAALFRNLQARQVYSGAVSSALAEVDPETVLEELLRGRPTVEQAFQAQSALKAMASRDIDKAFDYLQRITLNPEHRAMLAGTLAPALVRADPERALAWARETDRGMRGGLYEGVLAAIAVTDPEAAMAEARQLENSRQRRQAFSAIAMTLSEQDPKKAMAFLEQIDRRDERSDVEQHVAMAWLHSDPDAALSWIVDRGGKERNSILPMAAGMVAQQDLDTAMRWLPRLDEEAQQAWRAEIATNLALQRSVEEAQSFVEQYAGSDDYPRLLSSVINGVAQTDVAAAAEMAGRIPALAERDSIYSALVNQFGYQDPAQAAALLSSITDDAQRTEATAMLAMTWSHSDPESAQQWAQTLPRGDARDDAVMHLASNWDEMTPSRRLLVNSIGDLEKRKQAFVMHIQRIAQSDPERAESMMEEIDLSEEERLELQQSIGMFRAYP